MAMEVSAISHEYMGYDGIPEEVKKVAISDAESFLRVTYWALNKVGGINMQLITPYINRALDTGRLKKEQENDYKQAFLTRVFLGKVGIS